MKLEINYKKKMSKKIHKTWRLNNKVLNNQGSLNKRERKKYLETHKQKYDISKFMGCSNPKSKTPNKNGSKKEVHRPTSRNKKNLKQSSFTPKRTRERRAKPNIDRKIREEINEIEPKKTIEKESVKLRTGSLKI